MQFDRQLYFALDGRARALRQGVIPPAGLLSLITEFIGRASGSSRNRRERLTSFAVRTCARIRIPYSRDLETMKQKPKRLTPTPETLRELFLKSGNLCAYSDCDRLMTNADRVFIGQVCHIEAAEPNGERFNPSMTNEQRRAGSNLLLMCYEHHTITNDVRKFPVASFAGSRTSTSVASRDLTAPYSTNNGQPAKGSQELTAHERRP